MSPNIPSSQQPYNSAYGSGEIDIFELFQSIWQEKILVLVTVLVFAFSAAIYAFSVQPQYSISITLKPASVGLYGELVASMESRELNSIALGRDTSEEVLAQFKNNLELQSNQARYLEGEGVSSFQVKSKKAQNTQNIQEVTLVLTTFEPAGAAKTLQDYLELISELTVEKLNRFMQGLGGTSVITKEMLYSVDELPSPANLMKTNKKIIILVGMVFGGMFGVFAALIRSVVRKRKAQQAKT